MDYLTAIWKSMQYILSAIGFVYLVQIFFGLGTQVDLGKFLLAAIMSSGILLAYLEVRTISPEVNKDE